MSKICFISATRYAAPLDPTNEKKFSALSGLGEVFVVALSPRLRPRRFFQHATFYLLPGAPLALWRFFELMFLGPLLLTWLVLRRRVRIVCAQSPYEGCAGALAKKWASWLGIRIALVIESHGDFEQSVFMQRRVLAPALYRRFMRAAANFALKHADAFRPVSNSARDQLLGWAPGKPVFQFPAWTDIDVFLRVGARRPSPAEPVVLFAGLLIPRKGVHHVAAAFAEIAAEFPQAQLVLIGREENKKYTADLKMQIDKSGLQRRTSFVAEVTQAQLADWMSRATVLVLASYSEGLPRIIYEAMAAGLPVIATAISGNPELVLAGERGFLFAPGDEKALAQHLLFVLGNPQEAARMGSNAHRFARKFYSPNTFVSGYREIIHSAERMLASTTSARPLSHPGKG